MFDLITRKRNGIEEGLFRQLLKQWEGKGCINGINKGGNQS